MLPMRMISCQGTSGSESPHFLRQLLRGLRDDLNGALDRPDHDEASQYLCRWHAGRGREDTVDVLQHMLEPDYRRSRRLHQNTRMAPCSMNGRYLGTILSRVLY